MTKQNSIGVTITPITQEESTLKDYNNSIERFLRKYSDARPRAGLHYLTGESLPNGNGHEFEVYTFRITLTTEKERAAGMAFIADIATLPGVNVTL